MVLHWLAFTVLSDEKLKIEPWFINGWQTLQDLNSKPGLGGQIL